MSANARWVNRTNDAYTAAQHAAVSSLIRLGLFCPHRENQSGERCWVRVYASGEIEIVSGALYVKRPAEEIAAMLEDVPRPVLWELLNRRGIPYELRSLH